MAFFLQTPPTGVYPNAVVPDTDECWVFLYDKGWRPVVEDGWFRYWGGPGTEFIPQFLLESRVGLVDVLGKLISFRPSSGSFGVSTRGIDPGLRSALLGLIWHPDPEAFAACKAQEVSRELVARQQETFRDPGMDLTWRQFGSFGELFSAVLSLSKGVGGRADDGATC